MLLLTGATGTIGMPLLRRLTASGAAVRCLVRDPRRLGSERVRVQIALGDLSDHLSFRHALRGVDTVVHLASPLRDQPGGSIEELAGVSTWRLVQAAERAGVQRFVFFSVPGATTRSRPRLLRAKAVAERAILESSLEHTIFAPSWVYGAGDPFLTRVALLSLLPVVPIPGRGEASFQPIWAEDVADCVMAALPGGRCGAEAAGARYELGGPQTMTLRQILEFTLLDLGRRRRILPLPLPVAQRILQTVELLMGPTAPVTWDEAILVDTPALAARGAADAQALGVTPRAMADVLPGLGE